MNLVVHSKTNQVTFYPAIEHACLGSDAVTKEFNVPLKISFRG